MIPSPWRWTELCTSNSPPLTKSREQAAEIGSSGSTSQSTCVTIGSFLTCERENKVGNHIPNKVGNHIPCTLGAGAAWIHQEGWALLSSRRVLAMPRADPSVVQSQRINSSNYLILVVMEY